MARILQGPQHTVAYIAGFSVERVGDRFVP
jgi:hypothetical protein